MQARKRIRLLAVGGTISSARRPGATEVSPGELAAADLIDAVPQLAEIAEIEAGDVAKIGSHAMTPLHMHNLAREARRGFEEGFDGVVVTQGTDTIEETAYALALMLPRERPVILTGAMRNPTMPGADGPANVYAAFLAATTPEVGLLGPLVVLNDELHAARFVSKLHTTRVSTFASPGAGPVGEVVEDRVHLWFRPTYDDYLGLPDSVEGIDVELVRMVAGLEDTLLRAATARRPAGLVIEGTGGGHVPPPLLPAVDEAIGAGIPVVLATRCASGRNLERTYRMEGAETDLIDRGVVPAGGISGHKARLRLLVGIALGRAPGALFPV